MDESRLQRSEHKRDTLSASIVIVTDDSMPTKRKRVLQMGAMTIMLRQKMRDSRLLKRHHFAVNDLRAFSLALSSYQRQILQKHWKIANNVVKVAPQQLQVLLSGADFKELWVSPRREVLETGGDTYKNLFGSDSEEKEEEGPINEPQEISNDFDRQQEDFQAAQRVRGRPTTGFRSPGHDGSPAREGGAPHPRGYWPPEPSSGAELYLEQLVAPRGLIGGHTFKGAYERTLVQRDPLFTENIEAARCVLLAPHRIPLKEFTTRRKKPENRGGLHPVWGYPWVCPDNCQSSSKIWQRNAFSYHSQGDRLSV
ncbi:hypothetical protein C6341_g25311 [Phytophthora cactorum]|nr:hypothetical protein C6341_g25311 [Phytophthora cactorum]